MNSKKSIKALTITLTILSLLSACTQMVGRPKSPAKNAAANKMLTTQPSSADLTKAESVDATKAQSIDLTQAESVDLTKALSTDTTKAESTDFSKAISVDLKQVRAAIINPVKLESASADTGIALASDSEKIKKEENIRIQFKNLPALMKFANKTDQVMHDQKIKAEAVVKVKILTANEDSYCKMSTANRFNSADYLRLDQNETKQINQQNDIFETSLIFKNANGVIQFNCIHTTSNFYVEDFYKNFQSFLSVSDFDGSLFDLIHYRNPRLEKRMINAIKLIDIDKLEKIVLDPKKEGLGISHGQVDSIDKLSNLIAGGKEKMACMVAEKSGDFDKSKIYIRVEKGISVDTPKNIPTATLYSIYRADEKNYFVITCLMNKKAPWADLMEAAKGILQFEVLQRLEYNKKYDEVFNIHQQLKSKN